MEKGEQVRFTAGPLGLVVDAHTPDFEDETVIPGDPGEYVGPHPVEDLADQDWHLVKVTEPVLAAGRVLYCPCHSSQFEAIA